MRMLVLTDHATHGVGESLYALLQQMAINPACATLWIASRSSPGNAGFFDGGSDNRLLARRIDDRFVFSPNGGWFVEYLSSVDAGEFDFVFLRIDRPVSDGFLKTLRRRLPRTVIVNDPNGITETGSKEFLLNFTDLCPTMSLCRDFSEVSKFVESCPAVIKPLRGYGGKGILRIRGNEISSETGFESVDWMHRRIEDMIAADGAVLAVRYLPTIHLGDKRVIVVNGVILGAMLRVPREGQWLANLSQGGSSQFADVEPEECSIAEAISSRLLSRGVVVFGFDTLVDDDGRRVLSEINTLNVGGFLQAERHSGRPILRQAAELIWEFVLADGGIRRE